MKTISILTLMLTLGSGSMLRAELITEPTRTFTVNSDIADPSDPPMQFLQVINDSAILSLTRVEVGLHLIGIPADNGFASDMFVSLNLDLSPTSVLLNRVGISESDPVGFAYDGWNVTFRDGAANGDIHLANPGTGVLTGVYEPDGRTVATDTIRSSLLDVFNGRAGNGDWRLAVGDLSESGQMRLVEWSLTLSGYTVVPEPSSMTLLGLAAAGLALFRKRNGK